MNGSVRMGRVLGVPLRIHWTVPLLVMLFGYSLGSQTLPAAVPEQSNATYTVAGLAGALLLLASLLAHEAAHAITARKKGIEVQSITLWALGGMTEMGRPCGAGAAFLVAATGPLTSFTAGAAALGAGIGLDTVSGWAVPAAVLVWLGWVNVVLGVFNLLSAAPLDGGRVVQALMWWRTGDRERAEQAAARSGQVLGILLIALGWIAVLRGALGGLWLAVIGFFVMIAASTERQRARLLPALRGVKAADAMSSPVEICPDWFTVERCVQEVTLRTHHSTLVLTDFEGRPSGLLHLPRLARITAEQRACVTWRPRCRTSRPARRTTVWKPTRLRRVTARTSALFPCSTARHTSGTVAREGRRMAGGARARPGDRSAPLATRSCCTICWSRHCPHGVVGLWRGAKPGERLGGSGAAVKRGLPGYTPLCVAVAVACRPQDGVCRCVDPSLSGWMARHRVLLRWTSR